MTTLLVGFDSAWSATNSGALVGVLHLNHKKFRDLGPPQIVDFAKAEGVILKWQAEHAPTATLILIDQPTIVKNQKGQRPVENIVGSAVSIRYGGMQPANTSKREMFGEKAPIWPFLCKFGGPANPLDPITATRVYETYPVLAMIALLWMLEDARRPKGRLPKYNPRRKKTFSYSDWHHLCQLLSEAMSDRGLMQIVDWIEGVANKSPRKNDQDGLDACICLIVALYLAERKECLMVGNMQCGYIVVPNNTALREELTKRCHATC